MRINARIEMGSASQLEFLVARLGVSVSDVLRRSLDLLYKQQTAEAGQPLRHFSRHLGRYRSGREDGSVAYKDDLLAAMGAKWPDSRSVLQTAVHEADASYASLRVTPAQNADGEIKKAMKQPQKAARPRVRKTAS